MASLPANSSEGIVASVLVNPNEVGMIKIPVISSERVMVSLSVSPNQRGVASVPVNSTEGGMSSQSSSLTMNYIISFYIETALIVEIIFDCWLF